jgi:hypothetical protein
LAGIDTFYSCRKFFGVPDGAYLQLHNGQKLHLEEDFSYQRCSHLLKRIDLDAEAGYTDFIQNNQVLENNPIRTMSSLTQRLLSNINYELCKQKRNDNFSYLHQHLKEYNCLKFEYPTEVEAPMVYPLLVNVPTLKKSLIEKKIFVATYWPKVLGMVDRNMFEYFLTQTLVPLPVDQRYSPCDLEIVKDYVKTEIDG